MNVTHGEMTSISASPLWATAAFRIGTNCSLSPEKLLARKVAPMLRPNMIGSIGAMAFASPFLGRDPMSADADICPLVRPYTPLFSMT